jgi:neutral ceramidase
MAVGATMNPENTLQAGAAVSNITPPLGASLDGPISKPGPATHVHDDLFARCLALSDGQTTLAIAVCDNTMIRDDVFAAAKARVTELTGVPAKNIMMTATHSHSTPRGIGISQAPIDQAYLAFLSQRIADGVCRAINQLAPARIGVCTFSKPEHLHNRRWHMKPGSIPDNPFGQSGEAVRMNPPRADENLVEPAGPTDPQVAAISVQSREGTPLALLTNYGLHYVGGVRRGEVSADYYGMFCRYLAERVGECLQDPPFVAILANGASGNVNNVDFGRTAERKWAPYEKMRLVARDLADAVLEAIANVSYEDSPQLAAATGRLELAIRKPDSQRLQWARAVLARGREETSHPYEQIFAHEAIFLAGQPDHAVVELQAFQIGKLALCAIPAEVFAETGLAIRAGSPFDLTAIMSLANGYHGYLPTPEQHALGGYETWPARSSCLEEDGETKIRAEMMCLLAVLKAQGDAAKTQ